jgi:hypothetical protein
MSSIKSPYSEHRDIYLEILKKAEKEADKALIKLIVERLKESDGTPAITKDGCQIFAFPATPFNPGGTIPDELFWKSRQFWQDLVQFMAILGVGIGWFIFFCSLMTHYTLS